MISFLFIFNNQMLTAARSEGVSVSTIFLWFVLKVLESSSI